jgi:DNA-nicking Smr family endonuclease
MSDNFPWDSFTKELKKLKKKDKFLEKLLPQKNVTIDRFKRGLDIDLLLPLSKKLPLLIKGNKSGLTSSQQKEFKKNFIYDAKLDLHHLTLEESYAILKSFLMKCFLENKRKVLVITGKGTLTTEGFQGRIRGTIPEWLNNPELRPLILAYDKAPINLGGEGALVILLNKRV